MKMGFSGAGAMNSQRDSGSSSKRSIFDVSMATAVLLAEFYMLSRRNPPEGGSERTRSFYPRNTVFRSSLQLKIYNPHTASIFYLRIVASKSLVV